MTSEADRGEHDQLDELRAAREQLEQLVRAIGEIGSDLDLDVTLKRIVNAAIDLTGARYGVLGIRAADGSQQEPLTHGEFNDWFPHVSPDGKRIVFISFSKEVPAEQHPYYQHVYLREMPASGGEPKVIAYLYGGQGTINVPSWSPDSKRVAFVSHTGKAGGSIPTSTP